MDDYLKKLLGQSDKAELLDWAKENLDGAEKCILLCGYPDGRGGLELRGRQFGFEYLYELIGFAGWFQDAFTEEYESGETDAP